MTDGLDRFFSVYGWAPGRVLSDDDIAALREVLDQCNDEIAKGVDAYFTARTDVLREIGGDELVRVADRADKAQSHATVTKAFAHFLEKCRTVRAGDEPVRGRA